MLLIGAALLVRSFVALVNVDPGYDPTNVLTGRVYLSGPAATPERRRQIVEALVDRVRSSPGVVSAGAGQHGAAQLVDVDFWLSVSVRAARREPVVARALQYVVTPGTPRPSVCARSRGACSSPATRLRPIQEMVVNEAFVKSYMNDGSPSPAAAIWA